MKKLILGFFLIFQQAQAEYVAEIIFPDGEMKTYALSKRQSLTDLKVGWECTFLAIDGSVKGETRMGLLCNPKGLSSKDLYITGRCIELDNGKKFSLPYSLMLGNGKKATDITFMCK